MSIVPILLTVRIAPLGVAAIRLNARDPATEAAALRLYGRLLPHLEAIDRALRENPDGEPGS